MNLTPQEENELASAHFKLALKFASQFSAQAESTILDKDDLVQEGMIGFLRLLRRYNPAGGATLQTYAFMRMRGAMQDALEQIKRQKRMPAHGITDIGEISDIAGQDGRDWVEQIFNRQIVELVMGNLDKLSPKQRQIIEYVYIDGMQLNEVAVIMGRTGGAISKQHNDAIRKLRRVVFRRLTN
ncbi:MAG: sigma-70 family RNA polymerase sigma factor [Burkholderiales bacterium]|nr:sigma-70 family RNA polymerase sigma factor [Burkholderiales bacterium]